MGEPTLEHLFELLDGYPGFLPGLVVTIIVAAIGYRAVARRLGIGRGHGFLLLFGVGVIVSATLFPNVLHLPAIGYAFPAWSCDLSRLRPSPGEFLDAGEATANMLLFLPLGLAIGLLPGRSRLPAAALAFASPFVIELIQSGLPSLERRCQTADIADNLTGLLVGLGVGVMAAWVLARRRAGEAGGGSSTPEPSVRRP